MHTHLNHFKLMKNLLMPPVDQAFSALLEDLDDRGLLDETLVAWTGEFGRTPKINKNAGRDHWARVFSCFMAGGGIKGGVTYGTTDDFSYNIAENPVHIRDLNATILHCMGFEHNHLTYKFQGLNQKLTGTDAEANVIKGILA